MDSVSKELLNSIIYATNTFLVWIELKEWFDKINCSRNYQLHRDISFAQGLDSIQAYLGRLKLLWDEFVVISH